MCVFTAVFLTCEFNQDICILFLASNCIAVEVSRDPQLFTLLAVMQKIIHLIVIQGKN